jgi:hypothetical protein
MKISVQKEKDLTLGLKSELTNFEKIKKMVNDENLKRTTNKYDKYDYIGDNCVVELKTRRVRHNTYPTIFIGWNKIQYWLKHLMYKKDLFIFYKFNNGLFYVHFKKGDATLIDKCTVQLNQFARNDRGLDEFSDIMLIPQSLLNLTTLT